MMTVIFADVIAIADKFNSMKAKLTDKMEKEVLTRE